jgi:hypothetical protein
LLFKAFVRTDRSNLVPAYVCLAPLVGWLLQCAGDIRSSPVRARVVSLFVLVLATGSVVVPLLTKARAAVEEIRPAAFTLVMDGRAKGIRVAETERPFSETVAYVKARVPEGEKIFVGTTRHDRIYTNDVMLYFLANRHAGSVYHELFPGLATTESVQRTIIAELEANHVRLLVLRQEHTLEPNQSSVSSGVHVLDDYIRTHFAPSRLFGDYAVFER